MRLKKHLITFSVVALVFAGGAGYFFLKSTHQPRLVDLNTPTPEISKSRLLAREVGPPSEIFLSKQDADVRNMKSPIGIAAREPKMVSEVPYIDSNTAASVALSILRPFADSGNHRAACRVGAILDKCRQQTGVIDSSGTPNLFCSGVTASDVEQSGSYILQAALAGDINAMAHYVAAPPMSEVAFTDHLEDWRSYKEYAPALLQQAVQSGSVRALYYAYFQSIGGHQTAGVKLVDVSPYSAIKYGIALRGLIEGARATQIEARVSMLQAKSGLDQAAVAQAIMEGQQIRSAFFQSSVKAVDGKMLDPTELVCN